MCQIHNQSSMNVVELEPLMKSLAQFVQDKMNIKSLPGVTLKDDEPNSQNPLGKTAFYDPNKADITIYVTGRHPKDIMRSISHELVHHSQNERGMFNDISAIGEQGYAQKDPHLRNMEKEAYLKGNMCFRDWEDGYKNAIMESIYDKQQILRRKTMEIHDWKNKELQRLLMEKFGFGEGKPADDEWSKKQEIVVETEEGDTEDDEETEGVTEGEAKGKMSPEEKAKSDSNRPMSALKQTLKDSGMSKKEIAKLSDDEIDKKAGDIRGDTPQIKRNTARMTAARERNAKLEADKKSAAKRTKAKANESIDYRKAARLLMEEVFKLKGIK